MPGYTVSQQNSSSSQLPQIMVLTRNLERLQNKIDEQSASLEYRLSTLENNLFEFQKHVAVDLSELRLHTETFSGMVTELKGKHDTQEREKEKEKEWSDSDSPRFVRRLPQKSPRRRLPPAPSPPDPAPIESNRNYLVSGKLVNAADL